MQREQAEFRRGAEAYVRVVLKNFIHWRNLSDGYSGVRAALRLEESEKIAFKDLSEMKMWLIDIDNVRKTVNAEKLRCRQCHADIAGAPICQKCVSSSIERLSGFDFWGLVGDHLYCGISFMKLAACRRMSIDGVKALYWQGISAIFLELLHRGVTEEYARQAA